MVLPAHLAGRTGDLPRPAAPPPTDVAGAATVGGYWFGKTDASVFLEEGVTPARRQAIRERIERLDVVDQVYFESRAEAWGRLRELYKRKPEVLRLTDPAFLPESFRVRLDSPEQFAELPRALCPGPARKALRATPCIDGVETVIDDKAPLKAVLVPKPWTTTTDVTVFPADAGRAERETVWRRLEAIAGVAKVTYVTPAEAYRRLPEKLRRDGRRSCAGTAGSPASRRRCSRRRRCRPPSTSPSTARSGWASSTGRCAAAARPAPAPASCSSWSTPGGASAQPTGAGSVRVRP